MSTFIPALTGALSVATEQAKEDRLRQQSLEDEARKTKINLLSREYERGYGERSPNQSRVMFEQLVGEAGLPKDQAKNIIGMHQFLTSQQMATTARTGGIETQPSAVPGMEGTRASQPMTYSPSVSPAQVALAELQRQLQRVDLPPNERETLMKQKTELQGKSLGAEDAQYLKEQDRQKRIASGKTMGFKPEDVSRGEFYTTYGIDPMRYTPGSGGAGQFFTPKFVEFPDGNVHQVFTNKATGVNYTQDPTNGAMVETVVPPNSREYRQYGDFLYPTEGGGVGRVPRGSPISQPPGMVSGAPTPRQWMQLPGLSAEKTQDLIQIAADFVQSNEMQPPEAVDKFLGGSKTGLGGQLALELHRRSVRIMPDKLRDQLTSTYGASAKLDELAAQVERIAQSPDLVTQAEESLILEGAAGAMASFISRALGERGVLNEGDVVRAKGLIPGWKASNFAPDFAKKEINYFRNILNRHRGVLENDSFRPVMRKGGTGSGKGSRKPGDEFEGSYQGKRYLFKVQPNGKYKAVREVN